MSREENGAGEGSGVPEAVEGAWEAQSGEKEAQRDLLTHYNSLAGGCSKGGEAGQALLPCLKQKDWKKWPQAVTVRKEFFTGRVVGVWNKLPRGMVESPSLKVAQRCLKVALGTWFRGDYGDAGLMVGLDAEGLFQP